MISLTSSLCLLLLLCGQNENIRLVGENQHLSGALEKAESEVRKTVCVCVCVCACVRVGSFRLCYIVISLFHLSPQVRRLQLDVEKLLDDNRFVLMHAVLVSVSLLSSLCFPLYLPLFLSLLHCPSPSTSHNQTTRHRHLESKCMKLKSNDAALQRQLR
jgi:hypothetical protein